jgi:tripartite-type tricarboxylate transporter receptor subunit TctC
MPAPLSRRALVTLTLGALSAPVLAQGGRAAAPAWPTRPVRIIVGFPGGSTPDLTARAIAEPLSRALGQPVIVENRPGAGGNLAADLVAKATDNHTLGVMINGNMTIARLLNPRLAYDPLKDLAPISLIGSAPLVLAAPASAPGDSAQAFLQAARAAGDSWSYGTPGVGTVAHIGMELLKSRTGIRPVHVPYPGNPQVIGAMLGGQIQLALLPPALAAAQVRAGKLKAVGVTSPGRSVLAPDIPSLAEGGVAGFQLEIWNAAAAPASMPTAIVTRLSALISEIVRAPDMRQKLFQQGWQVAGTSAEGLANRIQADTAALEKVIRSQGIKVE